MTNQQAQFTMRKITFLLLFTSLSFSSYSQTIYQLDSIHKYSWQDEDWLKYQRESYEYGIGGIKETDLLNKVSADGISFTDNFRHTKSYNSNNFISEDIKELWNGSTWINDTKISTTYDGSDRILQELKQTYNGTSWVNSTKTENTYTEDLEDNSYYIYENDDWVLNLQFISTPTDVGYDREKWERDIFTEIFEPVSNRIFTITGNLIDNYIDQEWDETLTVPGWVNIEKVVVTHTPEDELNIILDYLWNDSSMDWETEAYFRTTYIRDNATYDFILLEEINNGGVWENYFRLLEIHDVNDNRLSSEIQEWDDSLVSNGEWVPLSFDSYTYDSNNNNTQVISQLDYGDGMENSTRIDKFWSEGVALSVTFYSIENVSLYPNPTTDIINIKIKNPSTHSGVAKLYSIQGKLIHTVLIEKEASKIQIPIEYEADGIYMLHIKSNGFTQTYKIVKGS